MPTVLVEKVLRKKTSISLPEPNDQSQIWILWKFGLQHCRKSIPTNKLSNSWVEAWTWLVQATRTEKSLYDNQKKKKKRHSFNQWLTNKKVCIANPMFSRRRKKCPPLSGIPVPFKNNTHSSFKPKNSYALGCFPSSLNNDDYQNQASLFSISETATPKKVSIEDHRCFSLLSSPGTGSVIKSPSLPGTSPVSTFSLHQAMPFLLPF